MVVFGCALLVPLKGFDGAKGRLEMALPDRERAALMRTLAAGVLAAGAGLDRWVVCADPGVAEFSLANGAQVIWRRGGLNPAVGAALDFLRVEGYRETIIAHGDIAGVVSFEPLLDPGSSVVLAATDQRHDGTNVLRLPLDLAFEVTYGPGSLDRHRAEAERLGAEFRVVDDPQFSFDIDTTDDLNLYRSVNGAVPRQ